MGIAKQHVIAAACASAGLTGMFAATGRADVGDLVHQIGDPGAGQPSLPFPGAPTFCSVGLAFDGASLYYDRCGDPSIYRIDPLTAALVDAGGDGGVFAPGIVENPNALAFDAKRNGLWIATQRSLGVAAGTGCGFPNFGMPIYFWDFDDNSVTLMFTISAALVNPATGSSFLGFCFVDGLGYNEQDPTTDADDELWFSDDVNRNLGLFSATACPGPSPCGDLLAGFDATTVDPSLSSLSGLAVGGANLYMGNDGGGDVFRALLPGLVFVDQFVSGDERQEDMECDPFTFGPQEVMWVRTTPQGGAFPDVITAYEIEPDTCGLGGQQPGPPVQIAKDYRFTNVCFEQDDDGDGMFDDDAVDCPTGTSLGDVLPTDAATGKFLLEAVTKSDGTVSSYNPGQYYAVSIITPLEDLETLWA